MNRVPALVVIDRVTKTYRRGSRDIIALSGVSLELTTGEIVLVRGRSGSGKTTLLNILAGWEEPDSGTISWGTDFVSDGTADRTWSEVSVIPQALGLLAELPIEENVALPIRLGAASGPQAGSVNRLLERLEIEHLADRSIGEAALGEQQRAAVARALITRPSLVLADEPTAHQDRVRLDIVWSLLREATRRGSSVLVASHNPEATDYADRIYDLIDGKLVRA